jgi:hypothetical protein
MVSNGTHQQPLGASPAQTFDDVDHRYVILLTHASMTIQVL